ncbi:hypothetical protein ANSO36C_67430 (plasmid) [Nostoc cf. commune SO-36]|uniref:Uncharacterized protein n=1 Tax=Nostoc cf. commune SO-36 TaxID=449208 RepID=A0ABM7ZCA5_NOSCO|nr:hypothetical protein [Nostoc commune]BDI20941.1 hypothetical protein ANSO36C_67430 [Nostoc cf. commune SO-36]
MNHQEVAELFITVGFSPELVEAARKISEKGGVPTAEEQKVLDELKVYILARLNPHKHP